jgi:hypothetical protein
LQSDKQLTRATHDLAAFERSVASRNGPAGEARRRANYAAYWMTYPFTLVECLVLGLVIAINYWICRMVFVGRRQAAGAAPRPGSLSKPKIDAENALGVMQTLEAIGSASGARLYWISGTLLGLERLGQPLPHDSDMDVGVDLDDPHFVDFIRALWGAAAVESIAPQSISLKARIQNPDLHGIPGGVIRFKSQVRNESAPDKPPVKTDIFVHYHYCGGSMHGSRNTLWWNSSFRTVQKDYGQRCFSVPEDAHLHLTENYGNYRQEVKDFENSIDCPNAMNIYSWGSLGYLLSRQWVMLKRGRVDRARQINQRIMATLLKGVRPLKAARPGDHLGS